MLIHTVVISANCGPKGPKQRQDPHTTSYYSVQVEQNELKGVTTMVCVKMAHT